MCKAMDYAQRINDVLLEAKEEREKLGNIIHEMDLMTCDLLHEIELNDIGGMYNAWKTVRKFKEVRIKRRKAKDEIRTLKILLGVDYQNLVIDINLEMHNMKKRQYNPRIDCKFTKLGF